MRITKRRTKLRDNFKPAGEVSYAEFASKPPSFINANSNANANKSLTKVQRRGLQYEKRAQDYILGLCAGRSDFTCICNPWVMFLRKLDLSSVVNFCQPDCLLVNNSKGLVIIVEIKLSHTADSWKQLRQLYEPVLRKIYSKDFKFALLEVVKWFDPHTQFPETYYYSESVLDAHPEKLGIHIFKPRGRAKK